MKVVFDDRFYSFRCGRCAGSGRQVSRAEVKDKLAQITNRVGALAAIDLETPPLPTNEWPRRSPAGSPLALPPFVWRQLPAGSVRVAELDQSGRCLLNGVE